MKLFYYVSRQGNFGDDLNGWLWKRLALDIWNEADDILFSGIGTIIGNDMPPASCVIVFGSGIGYRAPPRDFGGTRWDIRALRGPLTARVLGQPKSAAVTDGAVLLRRLPECSPLPTHERAGTIFIPHYESLDFDGWESAAQRAGVTLVDPRTDSHEVIATIRRSRLVLAESMHAAIIADTLRVPWVPLASSVRVNSFKWLDWTLSMDLPFAPHRLPPISALAAYTDQVQGFYGERHLLRRNTEEAAFAHYRRMRAKADDAQWPARRAKLKYRLQSLPGRIPSGLIGRRFVHDQDQRQIDRMAQALRLHAASNGFLSADRLLDSRVAELSQRFDGVVALARSRDPERIRLARSV